MIDVIYTWQALEKPVLCTQNNGRELTAADIYFRYVGETTRIKYPELNLGPGDD